jgi:flagellar motor switch protein FliM
LRVSEALSAFLRTAVEIKLESVAQLSYAEFLKQQTNPTYLASVRIPSFEVFSMFQMDLSVVFPLVDMILGGSGQILPEERDMTEIEEDIFETIGQLFCREMEAAWRPTREIKFGFERRQKPLSTTALIPASEKTLVLTFAIHLAEMEGKARIVLPSAVYTDLFKTLVVQPVSAEPVNTAKNRARLQESLAAGLFHAEMSLPISRVSVGEIFNLKVGSVLVLEPRVTDPILVSVAGKSMFIASPVRCGSLRGAQVQQVLSIIPKQGREKQ